MPEFYYDHVTTITHRIKVVAYNETIARVKASCGHLIDISTKPGVSVFKSESETELIPVYKDRNSLKRDIT